VTIPWNSGLLHNLDSFIQTEKGINTVLNAAYGNIQFNEWSPRHWYIMTQECPTGSLELENGAWDRWTSSLENFTWNASPNPTFLTNFWEMFYEAIRDANVVIKNVDNNLELSEEKKIQVKAEARFIRGMAYRLLHSLWGPVPLITKSFESPGDDFNVPRASEQEMVDFIEAELLAAAEVLPERQPAYERATKGAALGILTKFYLDTKQWPKAADAAKQIMDMGRYDLMDTYESVFALNNEGNDELIFVLPSLGDNIADGKGTVFPALAFPPQYPTFHQNPPANIIMPVEFYNTFEDGDERKELMLTSYVNINGKQISLMEGNGVYNPRSCKYPVDPDANFLHGGDIPYLRYADILLARAEALVMVNGVTPTALDLINKVRDRVGLDGYTIDDVPDQETFIDLLLKERGWEFHWEGKRRQDLVRHGRFIENARERGISSAAPHHVRYPIPQSELDANPKLEQNPDY
jgi:hypothetical protein